jgi:hypothetical protein
MSTDRRGPLPYDDRDIWSGYSRRGTPPRRAPQPPWLPEEYRLPPNPHMGTASARPNKRTRGQQARLDLVKTFAWFLAFVACVVSWVALISTFQD